MKIIKQAELKLNYKGTCWQCGSEMEASYYELKQFDQCEGDARGKCPVCSTDMTFYKK